MGVLESESRFSTRAQSPGSKASQALASSEVATAGASPGLLPGPVCLSSEAWWIEWYTQACMLTLSVSSELGLGKGISETLGVILARYPKTDEVDRVHCT